MTPLVSHRRLLTFAMLASLVVTSEARAVERTCGPDPVANTTNVLCASGTCTAALVRVTTAIEVRSGGCEFNLGGRALSVERNFQITGQGFIRVLNAGNITLTDTGRLNARGDFVQPNGFIVQGGLVSLTSSGVISIDGQIDVTGDSAGAVRLLAAGNVILEPGSSVTGRGVSSFPDLGMLFTDGGELDIVSTTGDVTISGDVVLPGANQGTGGILDITAAGTATLNRSVDLSGGGGDGGELTIDVGDDVVINDGTINLDSSVGAGFGGFIDITSGDDPLGGSKLGGDTLVTSASLVLRGSTTDQFGGDGGEISVFAAGDIRFTGSGMVMRLDAGTNFDGSAGTVSLDSGDGNFFAIGPTDGDIQVTGIVSMNSGTTGGDGGTFEASAGNDLTITATINASGTGAGGEINGDAGRAIVLNGNLTADALSATGDGGFMSFEAGIASDAANGGTLSVQKNLDASGGTTNPSRQSITLAACGLSVFPSVKIDGTAGTLNGINGGADIDLISRRAMQLGNNSQYLATPGGSITTIHPAGANPVIGSGVVFNPPRIDSVVASGPYPNCPVCGDNVRQAGEVCDKGPNADSTCCNATCSQFLCLTATPTPTLTATRTPTPTRTVTPTRTLTPLATTTPGAVATATTTATPVVPTTTRTATPVPSVTATPVATATGTTTPLPSATATPVATATSTTTPLPSATATPVATATSTTTPVASATATVSAQPTTTATGSVVPTTTPTPTPVETAATASPTVTVVPTATATALPSATATPEASATASPTGTPEATATETATPEASASPTPSPTASAEASATTSPTPSATATPEASATATETATPFASATPTASATATPVLSPTPTIAPTPSPQPTVGDCSGAPDADGDGIRNECDDVDAELFLRRARVRGGKAGRGEILARGELAVAPDAPFDPLLGVDIQVIDTLALDRGFSFAPADCSALRSGRTVCKAADGQAVARFDPLKAKPGRIRFDLRFRNLTVTEPFAPALLVRITTDPATPGPGVDRVGSLSSCRVTKKSLLCIAER